MKNIFKSFMWAIGFTLLILFTGSGIIFIGNMVRDTIGDMISIGISVVLLVGLLTYLVYKYTYK